MEYVNFGYYLCGNSILCFDWFYCCLLYFEIGDRWERGSNYEVKFGNRGSSNCKIGIRINKS